MSEAMALERMTQSLADLEGFLTEVRVPYLRKLDRSGRLKQGEQRGDLDVVGLGPGEEGALLVAECKGHGGPAGYGRWLVPSYMPYIDGLVWAAAKNVGSVSHARWGPEFARRQNKPTSVWVVFSGTFLPGINPEKWRAKGNEDNRWFVDAMRGPASRVWKSWEQDRERAYEEELLGHAERELGAAYGVCVRLLPVHRLLRSLFIGIAKDMHVRRKRYPDTALEMLRWTARTVQCGALDLVEIQESLSRIAPQDEDE